MLAQPALVVYFFGAALVFAWSLYAAFEQGLRDGLRDRELAYEIQKSEYEKQQSWP